MPDHVGEAVDKLISMEIKNRGMPFGILQPLYDAARKAAGGRPLTMLSWLTSGWEPRPGRTKR